MRAWPSLVLVLLVSIVIGACAGHDWMSPADIVRALAGDTDLRSRLLVEWRLPRVLAASLVGALLGLGGTVFQGVFRNPLAEPYLLGSAGGAALGATVALLVPLALSQSLMLPLLAFAGAWGATLLVIGISRVAGAVDAAGMLLAGVAVAAVLSALRSFLMLALSDETVSLQVVMSWVLGGIQTPTWPVLGLLGVITLVCFGLTLMLAGRLDVLGLGEGMATAFGLNVNRFIAWAVLAGSAGCSDHAGICVAHARVSAIPVRVFHRVATFMAASPDTISSRTRLPALGRQYLCSQKGYRHGYDRNFRQNRRHQQRFPSFAKPRSPARSGAGLGRTGRMGGLVCAPPGT